MCLFKRETEEYKIYYCSLLPYEINKNLKSVDNNSVDKIRIKMKEVKNFNHLENICRNFQLDKEMQKKMSNNMFEQENLIMEKGKTAKFSIWDKDIKNFKPQDLVGMSKYIYEVDEREYPIGVSFGMIYTIIEDLNAVISDKDKTIVYKDIKLETKVGGQKILFGKAFSFDLIKHTFNITIRGTFLERLNELRFIEKAFVNKCFLINNNSFIFDPSEDSILIFKEMLLKYENLNCILLKHNINKDLNFDEWKDNDFEKLNIWLSAIEDKAPLKLKSDISLIGSISIRDLMLSILTSKGKDNKFIVESLWNGIDYKKYFFMYKNGENEIKTQNLYLVLNYEAYLTDDVNFMKMIEVFTNYSLSDDEYGLLNSQVLEILKAFDINKNKELLFYAKF